MCTKHNDEDGELDLVLGLLGTCTADILGETAVKSLYESKE